MNQFLLPMLSARRTWLERRVDIFGDHGADDGVWDAAAAAQQQPNYVPLIGENPYEGWLRISV